MPTVRASLPQLSVLLLAGCASLAGGLFRKEGVAYRVVAPDEHAWRRVQLSENDLAWIARDSGDMLAVNATCKDFGDPSLEVLTNHLLIGFEDRELVAQKTETLDGREALRSTYHAKLDGVEVELELVVLKKNGCVHDFTFIAPRGTKDAHRAEFEALVAGFRQEARQ